MNGATWSRVRSEVNELFEGLSFEGTELLLVRISLNIRVIL